MGAFHKGFLFVLGAALARKGFEKMGKEGQVEATLVQMDHMDLVVTNKVVEEGKEVQKVGCAGHMDFVAMSMGLTEVEKVEEEPFELSRMDFVALNMEKGLELEEGTGILP